MNIRTIQDAQRYLEEHIRMDVFTRYDADKHLKTPLERIEYFLHLLGNPHKKYPSIQVTGTSGKGSTSYLISHIFSTAGYKTGFTLSPHLQKPNERLQINDQEISDQEFVDVLNAIIPAVERMTKEPIGKPSYFEILLVMAFLYFAKNNVDIVVAEVGLEGKYDGTNVLNPLVVVLTNISLDHTAILGDTVEKIASEVVSAIKHQEIVPCVVAGKLQQSVEEIVRQKAEDVGAKLVEYDKDFTTKITYKSFEKTAFSFHDQSGDLSDLTIHLKGEYQVDNAALAIEAVRCVTDFPVSETHMKKALSSAFFPGRFEVFDVQGKTVVIDGAHNDAKMAAFLQALEEYYPTQKKIFVVGFKRDKNIKGMLDQILPHANKMIITRFQKTTDQSKDFSMPPDQVKSFLAQSLPQTKDMMLSESSIDALELALSSQLENSMIVVTGSLYLIGEVRDIFTSRSQ